MSTPSRGGRRPPPPAARRTRRRRRRNERSETGARVLIAIPLIAFGYFIVFERGVIFAVAVLVLGILCLHELYELYSWVNPPKLAGFAGLIAFVIAAYFGGPAQVLLVAVALIPLTFGLTVARARPRGEAVFAVALVLLSAYWIGLAIAHAVLLEGVRHGDGILIDILWGTFVGDTCAYFGGRIFGQRPLSRSLSPNKTVEGLLIGMAAALAATFFTGFYEDWLSNADAAILGVGVALAAPVGDLFESLIKREAGAKDTGRALGAHGGVLDRLDAVLFTIPVGYYIWLALM